MRQHHSTGRSGLLWIILCVMGVGIAIVAYFSVQSLIMAANVRSTAVRLEEYNSAVYLFHSKFSDLPGDIKRASAFGLNGNYGKDGNGDTRLDDGSNARAAEHFGNEHRSFWVHLSTAKLIAESYDTEAVTAGIGYPVTSLGKGGIIAYSEGSLHYWLVGASENIAQDGLRGFFGNRLSPEEASAIDVKMDDGNPVFGQVVALGSFERDEVLTADKAEASIGSCVHGMSKYNITYEAPACTLRATIQQKY